ncbi:hypothetical protein EYR40_006180 [Pleurotus pulmonarius]|nr:hypothetical protein EYR40_006180 [Pleurotus pulmonarius]
MKKLISMCIEKTNAIIWMVDSSDRLRLQESVEILQQILDLTNFANGRAPILILANKQDVAGSISLDEIRKTFAPPLTGYTFNVFRSSCLEEMSKSGIPEAFYWLRLVLQLSPTSSSKTNEPLAPTLERADLRNGGLAEKLDSWVTRASNDVPADEYLSLFEALNLPSWDHYAHVRIAYIILTKFGRQKGKDLIFNGIERYIKESGQAGGRTFHLTMTYLWIQLVHFGIQNVTASLPASAPSDKFPNPPPSSTDDFARFLLLNSHGFIFTPMFKTRTLVLCLLAVHGVGGEANFNPLQHSGPASPYFDAPSQDGIPTETPPGCRVDQAAYILRHGSLVPPKVSANASYTARGPLAFIPSWVPPVDDLPHEPLFLTSTGAGEAFSLGVDLRKRYGFTKGGTNLTIWSASQQRVLDTGTYFLRGYLSQGSYISDPSLNRGFTISLPDSVNNTFADSLTPSTSCPLYASGDRGSAMASQFRATYLPNIARRLNQHFLDGLVLDPVDVGIMQDLCGFSAEINGDTRFCNIFEPPEWLDYEYAHDLNYYYGSGPGNPFSATVGFPWVKAITDIFVAGPNRSPTGASATPPPLIMGFTHDNNLPPIISALGVWNTSKPRGATIYPLSPTTPNPEHWHATIRALPKKSNMWRGPPPAIKEISLPISSE